MAPRDPALTLGVEEEYLLVDPKTRALVTAQPAGFMEACKRELGDQVAHELLQSQVEIGTGICKDVREVRADLRRLRSTVAHQAREHGMAMIAASTHPSASWHEQHNVDLERYRILTADFAALAWRLVISGMHVHAGIEDGDLRIDLMNQATYFLPHLLALSTSSPFWEGTDTGMKSFRPTIFGDLPRSGMPEKFDSYSEWENFCAMLGETGVCDDPTKIWWDVRPSWKQPTVELRITDVCTDIEDAITIAALWQTLLAMLYRLRRNNQTWRDYRRMLVAENKWRAQRFGVEGKLADFGRRELVPFADLIDEIIDLVAEEATRLGCLEEVRRARAIVERGTSADRQLAIYKAAREAGAEPIEARLAVVDWLIEASVAGTG